MKLQYKRGCYKAQSCVAVKLILFYIKNAGNLVRHSKLIMIFVLFN